MIWLFRGFVVPNGIYLFSFTCIFSVSLYQIDALSLYSTTGSTLHNHGIRHRITYIGTDQGNLLTVTKWQNARLNKNVYPAVSVSEVVLLLSPVSDDDNIPENSKFEIEVPTSLVASNNYKDDDEASAIALINDNRFIERNKHWIVFVDDEEAIRLSVGDFLYDSGYQVTACSDAMAVVEVCRASIQLGFKGNSDTTTTTASGPIPVNKLPSCIVSDIRMPGGPDGLELLQWIRSSDVIKRVPVVLLTAKGMTEDRIIGYKAGADAYLPKPFYPEELLSVIDTLILRRNQMTGTTGALLDIQQEMANVKLLLKQNAQSTVTQTDVYLTPAAREILEFVCEGYTNAEIAEKRGTSKNYVTKVMKRIYEETGTTTRTELLRWAIQTGYVNPKL
jgi:DNA-binding NarL/FixJ family response regulator